MKHITRKSMIRRRLPIYQNILLVLILLDEKKQETIFAKVCKRMENSNQTLLELLFLFYRWYHL